MRLKSVLKQTGRKKYANRKDFNEVQNYWNISNQTLACAKKDHHCAVMSSIDTVRAVPSDEEDLTVPNVSVFNVIRWLPKTGPCLIKFL